MAGLAEQPRCRRRRRLRGFCPPREGTEFQRCGRARHGRIEPRAGSAGGNVRQKIRFPEAARAGFHRSRAGARDGGYGRPRPHAVHRLQQIRRHHRAERDEGLFLRSRLQNHRQGQGRAPLHRRHRSRLVAGEGRDQAGLCPHLPWRSRDRRTLFRAVAVRAGAGGCRRYRHSQPDHARACDGALLRRRRAAARKPRRAARAGDGARRPRRPRQGDDHLVGEGRRFRRLGRTADRRIHRQGWQGPDPDRRRAARRSLALRQRSLLHRYPHRRRRRRLA